MFQRVKVSGSELAGVLLLYWKFSSREGVGLGAKRSGSVKSRKFIQVLYLGMMINDAINSLKDFN